MDAKISFMKNNTVNIQDISIEIASCWRKAVSSIIEAASLLRSAEEQLSSAQFRELRKDLAENQGISQAVTSKLKKIGENKILSNPANAPHLPPSYATLYELTRVSEVNLTSALKSGDINANTQLKDVQSLFPNARKTQKKKADGPIKTYITIGCKLSDLPNDIENRLLKVLQEIEKICDVKQR